MFGDLTNTNMVPSANRPARPFPQPSRRSSHKEGAGITERNEFEEWRAWQEWKG